jgi:hypothetical protein
MKPVQLPYDKGIVLIRILLSDPARICGNRRDPAQIDLQARPANRQISGVANLEATPIGTPPRTHSSAG